MILGLPDPHQINIWAECLAVHKTAPIRTHQCCVRFRDRLHRIRGAIEREQRSSSATLSVDVIVRSEYDLYGFDDIDDTEPFEHSPGLI